MITTAPLADLACYVPALILRRVSGDAGATMAPAAERFPAAVLFADLSGFTALTEHLTQHSPAGAEELTRILDRYFGHLVNIVTSHGGDVVKFAGDGLLALWYGDESLSLLARRAVQCGLAVQMMMAPDVWSTFAAEVPAGPLAVRIAVGAGEVTTMCLGGIFGRWELLVTGEALLQTGRAEVEARPGEVLIAPDAWPLLSDACLGRPRSSGAVCLDGLVDYLPLRRLQVPSVVPAMAEALRAYLPKAILARLDAGQTAWLAEQRRVTVLFVNLPDLHAGTPLRTAQAMMRALQSALYRYEGSITRLGTDAKGPTLVAALGLPPFSHENDAERGVRAAWDMHAALSDLGFESAIGVTSGRALCAAVGGVARREYTMMGAIVNRSARLMQAATVSRGGPAILCDASTFHAARARLRFAPLSPLALKGVAEPVPVYRPDLAGSPAPDTWTGGGSPAHGAGASLLGREREQALIAERLDQFVREGRGGVLIIEGEAGIGKSALLAWARTLAATSGATVLAGAGSAVDAPFYHAWRAVFADLIVAGAADDQPEAAARRAMAELDAAELLPLLGAVLPLELPETPVTAQLAGQLRAEQTRDLLVRLLQRAAARGPLVLALDNLQWFDSSSWALLQSAADHVGRLLITAAVRPMNDTPAIFQRLAYRCDSLRLQLRGLTPEALHTLLARRLGVAEIPEVVWRLIAERAQGNPFVGEELLCTLRDNGALVVAGGVCRLAPGMSDPAQMLAGIRLPATVQGLILSRIDHLTAAQQLTLKVASVIGPVFPLAVLAAVHPVERDQAQLVDQLFVLQQVGLVVMEAFEPELLYAFKHVMGCEVAYHLMSFAQRRRLHRSIAEYYERDDGANLAPARLAHHWQQAEEPRRALRYLALAGEQCLKRGAFAETVRLLTEARAIAADIDALTQDKPTELELARCEHMLGEAYHGMGRLIESRAALERAATVFARHGCADELARARALLVRLQIADSRL